jgi:hypothetical protein
MGREGLSGLSHHHKPARSGFAEGWLIYPPYPIGVPHEEGLAMARALDDYWLCAFCLEGLASVVAAQGALAWAARLWGAAESLRLTRPIRGSTILRFDLCVCYTPRCRVIGEETPNSKGRTLCPNQHSMRSSGRQIASTMPCRATGNLSSAFVEETSQLSLAGWKRTPPPPRQRRK